MSHTRWWPTHFQEGITETGRSILSMFVAIIATVAAGLIGSAENALAQGSQNLGIGSYRVDIQQVPPE